MRPYLHRVDEAYVREEYEHLARRLPKIWRRLDTGVDEAYVFGLAIDAHLGAVATAWALDEHKALAEAQVKVQDLCQLMLDRFDANTVRTHLDLMALLPLTFVSEATMLRTVCDVVHGRPHVDRHDRINVPASHHMLDAFVALVRDEDEPALAAVEATEVSLAGPETPPGGTAAKSMAAVRAVLANDAEELASAVEAATAAFAKANAPSSKMHASVSSLTYQPLNLICRVARWRGLHVPESPYLLPFAD